MATHRDVEQDDTGAVLNLAYIRKLHQDLQSLLEASDRLRRLAQLAKWRGRDAQKLAQEVRAKARQVVPRAVRA